MKIKISQRQNGKKYSLKSLNEFKVFSKLCLNQYSDLIKKSDLKLIELIILDHAGKVVYGNKNKPMIGFDSLYNSKTKKAKIYIYRIEGYKNTFSRISHEIVHLKQIITKEMKVLNGGENIVWKGKNAHAWKYINWKNYDNSKSFKPYIKKLPWEVEVNSGRLSNFGYEMFMNLK